MVTVAHADTPVKNTLMMDKNVGIKLARMSMNRLQCWLLAAWIKNP
jgi:hypothetical protein